MDEITVNYDQLDLQVARTLATSKRDLPAVVRSVARSVVRNVIEATPPSHIIKRTNAEGNDNSVVVIGLDAKKHGMACVETDIRKCYGTPTQAFDQVKGSVSPIMAKAFWFHMKRSEFDRAAGILSYAGGKQLYPFDWGTVHNRMRNRRGRVGRRSTPVFYVQNEQDLKDYIKIEQDLVGWLAGGWNRAAFELGIRPPQWIAKQESPGRVVVELSEDSVFVRATNAVKFASEINDLTRRCQYAVDTAAEGLRRRVDRFMYEKFKGAGFKVAA